MGKQEFICVECFSCKTFQSIIVSKKAKFQCKICNEKQSVRKIFAISEKAKDIRLVVQNLNENRGQMEEQEDIEEEEVVEQKNLNFNSNQQSSGKWKEFVEEEEENEEEEEDDPRYTTIDPSTNKSSKKRKNEKEEFQIVFESSNKKKKENDEITTTNDYDFVFEPKIQKEIKKTKSIDSIPNSTGIKSSSSVVLEKSKIKKKQKPATTNSKWGDYLPESSDSD